jgi:hypothetical protein
MMKKVIIYLLIINLSMVMVCCNKLFPDEELSIKRVDYNGKQLRIDGYYYYLHNDPISTRVLFLYRKGILLTSGYLSQNLSIVEKEMVNDYEKIRKNKTRWGVFIINDSSIKYEQWDLPTEIISVRSVYGQIENDTTFRITKNYFTFNGKTYSVNELWHFKQFDNKPDSTNNYIK